MAQKFLTNFTPPGNSDSYKFRAGALFYGTTSNSTSAMTVSIPGVTEYYTGLTLVLKMGAQPASGCTLNVNSLGAKKMLYGASSEGTYFTSGATYLFVYDGTQFKAIHSYNSNTTYSAEKGITLSSGKFGHTNSITKKTTYNQSTASPGYGGTFKITEPKYDAYGHITGVQVATITMPSAQTIPTSLKNPKALTVGSKTYDGSTAVTVSAADLGLSNALHFIGVKNAVPTTGTYANGDVILVGNKEYVYSGGSWIELGDESSFALKGHTHNYAGSSSAGGAANSVKTNLTIKLNGGTTEGTNLFTFNGSTAKTINITPSAIGAATSSHIHDDRYYTESETNTKLNAKLDKLTYEWNKEYNASGTAGYLLIGSFPMYDTNVTIDIDATTTTTYHGTVVIATQNVSTTSMGSAHTITVYGDPTGGISNSIRVTWASGSRNYNVYFVPSAWSKNLIHIRAIGQYMDTIDTTKICTQFTAGTAPTTTSGLTVVNALRSNFNNFTYTHPTTSGNKHIPAGGSSGQILRWSANGTAVWGSDNNSAHSHSAGVGLTGSGNAGTSGTYTYKVNLVNETAASNAASYTAGGTSKFYAVQLDKNNKLGVYVPWTDNNTTYSVVTSTANGLVPKFDAADGTIDSSSTDWVLTNNNGSIGWYKLPANAFKNDNTNYYHTPSYTTGLKVATGSGVGNLYVPTGTTSSLGVVKQHTSNDCTSYTSDEGATTPAAVKKAFTLFGAKNGIFYVAGNTSGTAGTWTGTNTDIPSLFTGLTIAYKIGIKGASATTLNLTTAAGASGAKTVRRNTGALTTHLAVGSVVHLTYDGTYWVWADYDSNTTYSSMSINEGTTGTATTNRVLTAANLKGIINAHAPTKTGSGASGTWGINITGSAGSVAWGNITGKPSTFTPSSHSHDFITYKDTRDDNQSPDDVQAGLTVHLKSNGTDGMSDGGSYHAILNVKDWGDYSGGPYWQSTVTANNNMHFRRSTAGTTWGAWQKVLSDNNYTNYTVTKTGSGASGTWGINVTGRARFLETKHQDGSAWYGDNYPLYAQWETSNICKIKCDNYYTKVDYADSATKATQDGSGNVITSKYVTLDTAQTISGTKTMTGSLKVSGRYAGSGDDEGIIVGFADNGYAGLCLGGPTEARSVFYFKSDGTKPFWRYNNGSANYDISHPSKSGTIALTSDLANYLPLSGGTLTGLLNITTNGKTTTFGCQNSSYSHYSTTADVGHWFNKNTYVQGNIYAGSSYNKLVLTEENYTNYAPTKTGGGASGTWGISITGNAATATKLTTNAGGTTTPVYFSGGVPKACTMITSGAWHGGLTYIGGDGVMEVGKYIDFHVGKTGTSDYDVRITAETTGLTIGGTTSGTFKGSLNGNASSATKLATARTISLTGAVTGSGSFDGSGNLSISTTSNHNHDSTYVNVSGDTMTGNLTINRSGARTTYTNGTTSIWCGMNSDGNSFGIYNTTGEKYIIRMNGGVVKSGYPIYGAVWNDYAEFRICKNNFKAGQVVLENGDDTLSIASKRLQRGCSIISDTFGFAIGETDDAKCPIAVSGRVLAYGYESREEFKKHIGWPVCSGPNGTISIMTEEEEEKYPSRIIGTISAVPDYETWGPDNIVVNNRIWIKVK